MSGINTGFTCKDASRASGRRSCSYNGLATQVADIPQALGYTSRPKEPRPIPVGGSLDVADLGAGAVHLPEPSAHMTLASSSQL